MPLKTRDGVDLYFETLGEGTPLVLLHGFMGTLADNKRWLPLFPDYQLILPDARGHGRSDKPHDPAAYRLSERTLDVLAILDELRVERAHCMGYSMGGWSALGMAAAHPERLISVVAGGISPDALRPETSRFWREPMIEALKGGMAQVCRQVEAAEGRSMRIEERVRYLAQDHEALIAMLSIEEDVDLNHALANSRVDLLLYVGDLDMHHDSAMAFCMGVPRAHFLSIPGRDHLGAAEPHDWLVNEVRRFLVASESKRR